ncbi:hypothetical protein BDM02DRAFT_3125707 [Thelephora ganbajun]|uniref:Uncharacterized protein n=1 Tax=Thelephora ganbajun TaxID=370292 RepID=A0ACB6ZUB3_THEGA|nr:hypothetical protein BDM02DRAFT_3125707 [Thelephora ganbajun]
MLPKSPTAVSIKERGNIAFKQGQMEEAAKLYRLAESKDNNDHTYPSNLSAALYELGDYKGCFEAICRATRLHFRTDVPFLLRISVRLAKCLTQGTRDGTISDETIMDEFEVIEKFKALASASESIGVTKEHQSAWKEWGLVLDEATGDRIQCKRIAQLNLAGMDFMRQKLFVLSVCIPSVPLTSVRREPSSEFFHTGTDNVMSLAHGWGSHETIPLRASSCSDQQLSNINFLFGGVGDGRHLLGTLIGLKSVHRSLSERQKTVARFHLTALDIHPASIARDLVFMLLLNELADGQTIAPETRGEVIATYMYAFVGVVMPDYCHNRLMAVLDDLNDRLSENPPRLPSWIHVHITSIPPVLGAIHYWIETAKTSKTKKALELHGVSDIFASTLSAMGMPGSMPLQPGDSAAYTDRLVREVASSSLEDMNDEELVQSGLMPAYISPNQVREYFERHKSQLVKAMMERVRAAFPSASTDVETKWYSMTKTLPIPKELEARHVALKQLLGAMRQNNIPKALISKFLKVHPVDHEQAQGEIETTWKPNITLHSEEDQLNDGAHKGYPHTGFNLTGAIKNLRQFDPSRCSDSVDIDGPARSGNLKVTYDWTSRMLSATSEALVALKGIVKVEFICAELFSKLQSMRSGEDRHRPRDFPRSFLRVWTSNIPDFTHGVINAITQVLPILQTDNEEAAVAMNCSLNTFAWASDEEFIYTYTLLLSKDIPRFLGCRIITKTPTFGILSLGRLKAEYPLPLSRLATRKELTHWLSTQLINILVPGMIRDPGPNRVRFANNTVAFFRLLLYLHSIGYPSHWLSEFLQSVLWNDLTTQAVRAKEIPIPVSHATVSVNARKVDLAPWVPEFEMILACTRVGLPFHVWLPENFATTSEEIGTYEANYRWFASCRVLGSLFSPFDHAAMLVFWRSRSATYPKDVSQMITDSVSKKGRTTPRDDLVVVRWKLAKKRVEKMKREGDWEMAIFRSDACVIASNGIPPSQWRENSPETSVEPTLSCEAI